MRAGLVLALISAVCFGFSGPAAKALSHVGLSPVEMVWLRLTGASLLLLGLLALVRPNALRLPRRLVAFVTAYAFVAMACIQVFYFGAVSRLPVGVALLIEYLAPVLVLVYVRVVRRTRVPPTAVAGAALAVIGLACVVEVWRGLRLDLLGLLLALGAAASLAGYFLLSDAAHDDIDPLGLVTWGVIVAGLMLLPLGAPWNLPWASLGHWTSVGLFSLPAWGLALWLIVVSTVIGYVAGVASVRRLSAPIASIIGTIEVLVATLAAWFLLGEHLSAWQLVGGALLICGALLAQRAAVPASQPVPPAPSSIPAPAAD